MTGYLVLKQLKEETVYIGYSSRDRGHNDREDMLRGRRRKLADVISSTHRKWREATSP